MRPLLLACKFGQLGGGAADLASAACDQRQHLDGTVVHTTEEWSTVIGDDCVVGHNAHLEGCTVENRCLVGSGSVVLNRAVLRAGSVVGANALVPENLEVPADHRALGIPARLGPIDPEKHAVWIAVAVRMYTDNAKHYRDGLRRIDQEETPMAENDIQARPVGA